MGATPLGSPHLGKGGASPSSCVPPGPEASRRPQHQPTAEPDPLDPAPGLPRPGTHGQHLAGLDWQHKCGRRVGRGPFASTGDGHRPIPPSARATAAVRKQRGLRIIVGGGVGTSLGIAPALLVAQQADIVDLDGPLRLAVDRGVGLRYDGSTIHPPDPKLWGGPG